MLINDLADVVSVALDGVTRTADGVARLAGSPATAIRNDVAAARAAGLVAVISGGGAGHDPAHAGYVGAGMLTAAVSGPLFTPPPAETVLAAIRAAAAPAGVLLVVPNDPADRLNFALAAELARAEGIRVEVVPVGDDVARGSSARRGLAGTILVQKVAGAAAAAGRPLAEVAALARRAAETAGTMGVALGPCTATAAGGGPPPDLPTPDAATPPGSAQRGLADQPDSPAQPGVSVREDLDCPPGVRSSPDPASPAGQAGPPGTHLTSDPAFPAGQATPSPNIAFPPQLDLDEVSDISDSSATAYLPDFAAPDTAFPPDAALPPDLTASPDTTLPPELAASLDAAFLSDLAELQHLDSALSPAAEPSPSEQPGLSVAASPSSTEAQPFPSGQPLPTGLAFAPGEAEWGPGANGEPGIGRGPAGAPFEVAARLISAIVEDRGIAPDGRVALLVNGLGATSPTELSIMAEGAVQALHSWGMTATRVWSGNFLTTLDMAGVSLTLLPLDDDLLAALDAPTTAPAWPRTVAPAEPGLITAEPHSGATQGQLGIEHPVRRALEAVAEALISVRDELTALDRAAGDGDLGVSLALGAAAVLAECPTYPGADGPAAVLRAASDTIRRSVTGVSGPLYAILLLRAAAALPAVPGPHDWAAALRAGLDGVREAADAEPGDRTMVDALAPAAVTFADHLDAGRPWPEALTAAVEAATTGADATVDLPPRLGRAGHLGMRVLGHPDPGAQAVAIWLRAAATALHP